MIKIAVCDDEKKALSYISSFIEKLYPNSVRGFSSGEELEKEIQDNRYFPQVIAMDIELSGRNGISFAKRLNELIPNIKIVFITGYVKYATQAYDAKHFWFITKDKMEEYLPKVLKLAIDSIHEDEIRTIAVPIKYSDDVIRFKVSDIIYLERRIRTTLIVTNSQSYETNIHPSELISDNCKDCFIRCNQNDWVCIDNVQKMKTDEFVLVNNVSLPITRTFREEARKKFFDSCF